jgi:primase-polymerase (primpol)-like protein
MSSHPGPWLAPNWQSIPPELQALPRWVVWRISRGTKVPFDPNDPETHASVNRPETWSSYETARSLVQARKGEPDAFEGVGIVLNGDGLVGVDLDGCVLDGQPTPATQQLLNHLGPAYVEWSPSGRGIRIFGYARPLPKGLRRNVDGISVELYSAGRYLTVTGHALHKVQLGPLIGFTALAQRLQASTALPGQ